MTTLFTPGDRYRDAMEIDGRRQIVRETDGVHLNADGAALAADWCSRLSAEISASS